MLLKLAIIILAMNLEVSLVWEGHGFSRAVKALEFGRL